MREGTLAIGWIYRFARIECFLRIVAWPAARRFVHKVGRADHSGILPFCIMLSVLGSSPAIGADRVPAVRPDVSRSLIDAVIAEQKAQEEATRACRAGDLRQRVMAGTADPKLEAEKAAARGCFALVVTLSSIPSGVTYAVGLQCRPNQNLFGRLALFHLGGGSDLLRMVPFEPRKDEGKPRQTDGEFAFVYNRTMAAAPNFPFRDLCRPATDYSPGHSEQMRPAEWGFRDLVETDQPIDMHEAARRGTVGSLRRMIEAQPLAMHVPDLLRLTPLAWAVVYKRPDHVRLLLEAGAHPYGEPYWRSANVTSPVMIARIERNRELVSMMRLALQTRGLPMPAIPAALDPSRSKPVSVGGRVFELGISPMGRVTECHAVVGNQLFSEPATCDRLRESLFYLPAEDGDGSPIASKSHYARWTDGNPSD